MDPDELLRQLGGVSADDPDAALADLGGEAEPDAPPGVTGMRHSVTVPTTEIVAGQTGPAPTHGDVVYSVETAPPEQRQIIREASTGDTGDLLAAGFDEMQREARGSSVPGAQAVAGLADRWLGSAVHPERGTNFGEAAAGALSADLARAASAPPRIAGWLNDAGIHGKGLDVLASARQTPAYQDLEAGARRGDVAAAADPAAALTGRTGAAIAGGALLPQAELGQLPTLARILASGGIAGAENAGLTALTSETPESLPEAAAGGAVLGAGGEALASAAQAIPRAIVNNMGGRRGALREAGAQRVADLGGVLRDLREVDQDYPGGTREFGRFLRKRVQPSGMSRTADETLENVTRQREAAGRTIGDVLARHDVPGTRPTTEDLLRAIGGESELRTMAHSTAPEERGAVGRMLDQVVNGGGHGLGPSASPTGEVTLPDVERVKQDLSRQAAYGALGERTPRQAAARAGRRALTRGVEERMAAAEELLRNPPVDATSARMAPEDALDAFTRPAAAPDVAAFGGAGQQEVATPVARRVMRGADRPVPPSSEVRERLAQEMAYPGHAPQPQEVPTADLAEVYDQVGGIRPSTREDMARLGARQAQASAPGPTPEERAAFEEARQAAARSAAARQQSTGPAAGDLATYRRARRDYQGLSRAQEIAQDAGLRRSGNRIAGLSEQLGMVAGGGGGRGLLYAALARLLRANEHLGHARLVENLVARTAPRFARRATPAAQQAGSLLRQALATSGYVGGKHD